MKPRSTIQPAIPQIKPSILHRFHRALGAWYAAHGRHDLPWRNTPDPYAIWVSEVMLQQTQVETVRTRFYAPFLARFPTLEALATAPREAVMKAWEGLGYYRRAGHLHEAAKRVVSEKSLVVSKNSRTAYDSRLTTLLALPGVGRNTAHAILAFGFHQPYAVMEANVKRVLARLFALEHPSDAELWQLAEALLNYAEPFNYNQAMMDLGAMLCTPKAPDCAACPAAFFCEGKTSPEHYPAKKLAKKVPTRRVVIVVQRDAKGRLLLEQREDKLLGGLYGFVQIPHPAHDVRRPLPQGEVKKAARNLSPRERSKTATPFWGEGNCIGHITHVYSHFRLQAEVVLVHVIPTNAGIQMRRGHNDALCPLSMHGKFYTLKEIENLPLSKLDHKVLALLAT